MPEPAWCSPSTVPPGRHLSELAEQAVRCTADCCGADATVTEPGADGVRGGRAGPVAVTHPDLASVVTAQLRSGAGPIPEAIATGEPVGADDLLHEQRWPEFRARALDSGVRAAVTLPFPRAGLTVVLSLYSFRSGTITPAACGPARALGELASTCLVRDERYRAALAEIDQLGTALRTRPVVDQASGIVMHVLGCGADDAFAILRRISQHSNEKLADVAAEVVRRRGRGLEKELSTLAT
ncbi:ANTAR domain-containing protein [Streptomyces sp. YC504]|uniref:ANTAR domain-containing protein n=1 Tax=Streptomyces mesophilus TaxID=1775132 RepID=A0A6G4XIQ0_9ACTN|nr:GAF and ANTAR domain-containing protein [Streptomyces mesophilus]NGO77288.1 ANTAR domain-containing protein [Streptomyces mesophilus]